MAGSSIDQTLGQPLEPGPRADVVDPVDGLMVERPDRDRPLGAVLDQGHELAGYRVALLYLRGRGVEKPDLIQAHLWFSISAARGVGDAADWRDRIEEKLTKRQRAESARLLAEHLDRGGS